MAELDLLRLPGNGVESLASAYMVKLKNKLSLSFGTAAYKAENGSIQFEKRRAIRLMMHLSTHCVWRTRI